MSLKRVLIVHENRLLSNFYREHLESGGFHVEAVRSGDAALEVLRERQPDAVVIDSLMSGREAADVIREIRADPATQGLPVLALPGTRAPMMKAVQQAGATRVLGRAVNPPAELTDALQTALGNSRTATLQRCMPLTPDPSWLKMSLSETPTSLNTMRHSVQSAMHAAERPGSVRALLQEAHGFAEQMALFGQTPLFHFAAALEGLIFDLNRFPDQANPSTLRTIGQSIDFCAVLHEEARRRTIRDVSTARVLIVDDEDGARKIMMAAMGLVNVMSLAADSPANALAILRTQTFDLIYLDVGLPEMTGFELCNRIRSNRLHERTPIVFITGMATFQNRVQSSLSGGNDFIAKPFSAAELGLKALIWVLKGQLSMV
jgi:CheY-like chemotaxis protein